MSRFMNHKEVINEEDYKSNDRFIPKGMQTSRKQSIPSLSIIVDMASQNSLRNKGT